MINSTHKIPLLMAALIWMPFNIYSQATDHDGKTYKTVTIGTQIWLAENLDVSHFRNGDPIPEVKTNAEWEKAGEGGKPAWCYYENDASHSRDFGKLYNWYAVNDPRGLAPTGWHVPTDKDCSTLETFLGGGEVASNKMKSANGWKENGSGNNESGFNGLPGGCRNDDGLFSHNGFYGYWWSSTEYFTYFSWGHILNYFHGKAYKFSILYDKVEGLSVRCIKD